MVNHLDRREYPPSPVDRGETREQLVFGGIRGDRFIQKVAAGELIDGQRYSLDDGHVAEFIMELHSRVCNAPGVTSFLRQSESTTVGGELVTSWGRELENRFYAYCRWLGREMGHIRNSPNDLISALQVAAAAHYGLTTRELHPFDNGNGRTARALVNAILMSQTYELTANGLAVPPIPILRSGNREEDFRYIQALRGVQATGTLNPLMTFLAQKWINNLTGRLDQISLRMRRPITAHDRSLVDTLKQRLWRLEYFVKHGQDIDSPRRNNHQYHQYPIPDYFQLRYIKV